ncbi:MAG TPA: prepilin-type N-terminal cleavage/methylation domain-containing protein [Longimicrobiales bacterium]
MPGTRTYGCVRAERGFTLLEALVALAILGTAVIGAIGALRAGLYARSGLDAHITAVALAESRMAGLDALPRDSLLAYATGRNGVFAAPFADYAWAARVRPIHGGPDGLVALDVRVTWADGEYGLSTIVYRPDPLPRALRRGP